MKYSGKKLFRRLAGTVVIIATTCMTYGQDFHLSQYNNLEVALNPSLTGMFKEGNIRCATDYRTQWSTLGVNYASSVLALDMPLKERWGVGMYMMNNVSSNVFNTFNFVFSGAYEVTSHISSASKKYLLLTGIQLGMIHKSTNNGNLVFDKQYTGETFDPDLPSYENFEKDAILMPEINWGIAYVNVNTSKKVNPYGGFSLFHVSSPKESFYNYKKSHLPRRWVINGGSKIVINDNVTIDPHALVMLQSNAKEYLFGLRSHYTMTEQRISITGGLALRLKDAFILQLGLDYNNIRFQASYDINTSVLKEFSNGRGATEFSLVYIVGKK